MPNASKSNEKMLAIFNMHIASLGCHRCILEKSIQNKSNIRASIFMMEKALEESHGGSLAKGRTRVQEDGPKPVS